MYLFKKVSDLQRHLERESQVNRRIGFVPTMGALHEGHLSLIERAKASCEVVVCSVFVNPTQFNETKDLDKYPRTIVEDIRCLTSVENDVLFLPPVSEVYPEGLDTTLSLDFGDLDKVMEGHFRPGHFEGMAQVVWRLLQVVRPDQLFMGQKDFQQWAIVQSMLQQLNSDISLVMCPIVREEDGLAMSSRNLRLTEEGRAAAPLIHQVLNEVKAKMGRMKPAELKTWALDKLNIPEFRPEYFEIVDGHSLQNITDFGTTDLVVACTAVWAGKIRLIDNLVLKG